MKNIAYYQDAGQAPRKAARRRRKPAGAGGEHALLPTRATAAGRGGAGGRAAV